MKRPTRPGGFSLVELLVVIGIIAVLLAVMLPVLGAARESARTTLCQTRARAIGTAMVAYLGQSRWTFPASRHSFSFKNPPRRFWDTALAPFLGEPSLGNDLINDYHTPAWLSLANRAYRCPNDPRTDGSRSYAINVYFELTRFETPDGRTWRRLADIPRSASTVMFGEVDRGESTDHVMAHFWKRYGSLEEVAWGRHRGQSNLLYVDGHVVREPREASFDPPRRFDRWDPSGQWLP